MDRQTFFEEQDVAEDELNELEDDIEKADKHILDGYSLGALPIRGLVPSPDSATLVLPISHGVGVALDGNGDPYLVKLVADGTINLAPALPAVNPKWVLVALHFIRHEYDPRVDGENVTIQYQSDESSELLLVQGAEGGGKPAIPVDCVPLCDFHLTVGQAALTPAKIDRSRARPSYGKVGSPGGVAAQIADLAAGANDNCRVVPDEPADLSVIVRAGGINFHDKRFTVAGGAVGPLAAPATPGESQVTLVYIDNAGAIQTAAGAAAATGTQVPPSHVGRCPLAEITLAEGQTSIQAADIRDVRPFLRTARSVPGYYLLNPAAGGETAIALGFTYLVGAHAIEVFKDGVKLIGGGVDYTETDSSTITLGVAMVAGHKLEVMAAAVADANPTVPHAAAHAADGADPIDYSTIGGVVAPGFEMFTEADNQLHIKPFSAIVGGKLRPFNDLVVAGGVLAAVALGNNAWWYVYGYWDPVTFGTIEFSATGPDAKLRFKTGDTSRVYLGAFISTSTGKIKAFHRMNRHTVYKWDRTAAAGAALYGLTKAIANPGDTAAHPLDLSLGIPNHANMARLWCQAIGGADGNSYDILDNGASGQGSVRQVIQLANANLLLLEVPLSGQSAQYKASVNAGVSLNIWSDGWDD